MRYSLRTLLIALALGPPALAWFVVLTGSFTSALLLYHRLSSIEPVPPPPARAVP